MSPGRHAFLKQCSFVTGAQKRIRTSKTPHNPLLLGSITPRHRRFQTTFAEPEPVRRSIPGRIVRSLLTATVFVSVGIIIGWETLPSRPSIAALFTPAPSDAETLSLYQPQDAVSADINARITNHAISKYLRQNSNLIESRPHLKIPEPIRATNLTGGTLSGPGRLVVPPLVFSDKDGKEIYVLFYLGEQLCGHPGIVHGGMLATLLDEGLARCCFPALPNKVGVTANLKIDYRKPTKASEYYLLKAKTTRVEGRKAWVGGWIEKLDGALPDQAGEKIVEAEALFIEPRNAAVMKRIYNTG